VGLFDEILQSCVFQARLLHVAVLCTLRSGGKRPAFKCMLIQMVTYPPQPNLLGKATATGCVLFLLVLQFPFFLGIELGFLALFLFAFIFTSFVAHICFSLLPIFGARQIHQADHAILPAGEEDCQAASPSAAFVSAAFPAPAVPFGVACASLRAPFPAAAVLAGAVFVPALAVSPTVTALAASAFGPGSVPALGAADPVDAVCVLVPVHRAVFLALRSCCLPS
jgi:hypothetical protein